ncbi:MAG: endonuclease Q family protein [Planctomycetota bacterium]|jgi:PHP family Zn ribbon phosphoesterase|nr:endonuclease Q family protein [Planctomycetota bacterium]
MRYNVDLHSHSGYAGGVGKISLPGVAATMAKKGIDAFGVGDCLQPAWREKFADLLEEREAGLYALRGAAGDGRKARFVMQTEVIFTSAVPSGGRKATHTVLLFPNLRAVDAAIALLLRWKVKLDMGRPFIKCADAGEVAEKCSGFMKIDPRTMVIPAHVMTPRGVFGSDHPVDRLSDVYGGFAREIAAVETGLSADPALLALLPELDGTALISNSDCHSEALARVGREFTALEITRPTYEEIVLAIRERRILLTAEFDPAEGRYFLSGHRAGLSGHGGIGCWFSPDRLPPGCLCPVCGKKLTIGVLDRVLHLSRVQTGGRPRILGETRPNQKAVTLVPLVEVLAAGLGVASTAGRRVNDLFETIIGETGTEAELWDLSPGEIEARFSPLLPERAVAALAEVRRGNFSFQPGYDGEYGGLRLGEKIAWFGQAGIANGD